MSEQKKANAAALKEGCYSDPTMEEKDRRLRLFEQGKPLWIDRVLCQFRVDTVDKVVVVIDLGP